MAVVEERVQAYRDAGWQDVVILERGEYFHIWEHARCTKSKGGNVFITITHRGEVTFHEGYITTKEARKREKIAVEGGEATTKPIRPEISAPIKNYIDLHRHAAVRASLVSQPSTALRLMVAHTIVGSPLWRIDVEQQRAHNDTIAESVETSASEATFDAKRCAVLAMLGFDPDTPTVVDGYGGNHGLPGLFVHLMTLPDEAVLDVLTIVMGETLAAGSEIVELLGVQLGIKMANVWQADDALLDLVRDREVIGRIVAEVAGEEVAAANACARAKVQRQIVRDCLSGIGGRSKVDGWVPRWMAFPPSAYTERSGVGTVELSRQVEAALNAPQHETLDTSSEIEPFAQAA